MSRIGKFRVPEAWPSSTSRIERARSPSKDGMRDDDTEETLSSRILAEEHRIYTEAVRIVLEGKYRIVGRRVVLEG